MRKEERWYEIIDDKGVVRSGNYEDMVDIFDNVKSGKDSFFYTGDLKLVEVIDIHR